MIPNDVHAMARRIEELEQENAKLLNELAYYKTGPTEKLRQYMLQQLREAKDNIINREHEISRMLDEGCPNSD